MMPSSTYQLAPRQFARRFLFATSDLPPRRGGAARYHAAVVKALGADGAVYPVCLDRRHWAWLLWELPRALRRHDANALIVSEILPIGTVARIIRMILRTPYVVICHGLDLQSAYRVPRKRWLAGRALRGAHCIIANSAYTASLARELGAPSDRLAVVLPPIGITPALALPAQVPDVRLQYNLERARIILSVGRLIARKGFDTLIRAMVIVKQTHPRAALAIIGDGPERSHLEEIAQREGLAVRFLGALDDATTAAWYRACDMFALLPREIFQENLSHFRTKVRKGGATISPPLRLSGEGEHEGERYEDGFKSAGDVEGFGIVYLEAAAFGKPVVGTRSGGVPEAVLDNETGLLVPPDDPSAAAAAITRLFSDRAFAERLGTAARTRAQQFTQDQFSHHLRAALAAQ